MSGFLGIFVVKHLLFYLQFKKRIKTRYIMTICFLVTFITTLSFMFLVMNVHGVFRNRIEPLFVIKGRIAIGLILVTLAEYCFYKYAFRNYINRGIVSRKELIKIVIISNVSGALVYFLSLLASDVIFDLIVKYYSLRKGN